MVCTLTYLSRIGCADNVGIGAISYVEYARRLFPGPGESDYEINQLTAVMRPGAFINPQKRIGY